MRSKRSVLWAGSQAIAVLLMATAALPEPMSSPANICSKHDAVCVTEQMARAASVDRISWMRAEAVSDRKRACAR